MATIETSYCYTQWKNENERSKTHSEFLDTTFLKMVTSTNKLVSRFTNKSVARSKEHTAPSPNLPDQRKIRCRELMHQVNSIVSRATKLYAYQLEQRNRIERTLALRKIRTNKTLITAKERIQTQAPPNHDNTGYTPTLKLQSSRRSRSEYNNLNNLNSNSLRCTHFRKSENDVVTPHLQSTGEQDNSLHDHHDPASAHTTHTIPQLSRPSTVGQCENNLEYLVKQHNEKVEASITHLKATTSKKITTIPYHLYCNN